MSDDWTVPVEIPNAGAEYVVFRAAAIDLRDAELALQDAQVKYRDALTALNKAVAPVPK